MNSAHFALDIGTRTVVGLVTEDGNLNIKAACVHEHNERSMQDGQIHDVEKVAKVVDEVRDDLEKETGCKLSKVAVAVAGRALKTSKVKVSVEMPYREISREDISELEFEAVARAGNQLGNDKGFNCVGYSVVHYELDGERISNIIGQKGSSVTVEVLATFLPEAVISSMFAVLDRCGLEASSVTLEPIAALNVAIPSDMRKLNIALVDIGAGTSDIAITDNGTVIGYGMVPEAGDEITDFICDYYLVDFKKGENIKRSLTSKDKIELEDIFGVITEVPVSQVISDIEHEVEKLAMHIAEEILTINEKVPRAVALVGGGSQTAGLREHLSKHLDIPVQRIGSRLPKQIEGLADNTGIVTGADMITPLGIARMAILDEGIEFIDLTVNGLEIHLMDINGLSVMDALVAAKVKRLYPRPGMGLSLTVNSELRTIEGDTGEHATILHNGKKASLGDPVHKGSVIDFTAPVDGKDAKLKVRDLIKMQGLKVAFNINVNYNEIEIGPFVTINGKKASFEETIPDRADIKIRAPNLEDVLEMEFGQDELEKISVVINNTVQYFDRINYTFKLNGNSVDRDKLSQHPVNDNDIILIDKSKFDYRIENILSKPEESKKISVLLNGNEIVFDGSMPQITLNGKRASLSDKIDDGDNIKLKLGDDADPILSDLFEFMDIKKEELVGKRMRLLVNNVPARFTTPLRDGNNVTIEFAEV
ncbi:actin-like ATPase involved in cell division [Methanolobus tindarius DSM 2278]|uniref:Actin-like ATPase involved in cell division n=1 Tax=Methanolobus tindarius DSM 2278 TaxID=1090322 RepID=W9DUY6_METTI|nr:cell division protein FtsA [Methanolobus tindarius]ETA67231.1 actin-like ATPase involved in cell division [Methanolobus tindarius DSM 2278]